MENLPVFLLFVKIWPLAGLDPELSPNPGRGPFLARNGPEDWPAKARFKRARRLSADALWSLGALPSKEGSGPPGHN